MVISAYSANINTPCSISTYSGSTPGEANGPLDQATYFRPYELNQDSLGRIWVVECATTGFWTSQVGGHRIRMIGTNGIVSTVAGAAEYGFADGPGEQARFQAPSDIVFDTCGNAFVADNQNHRIRKIDGFGVVSTFAGSTAGYRDGYGTNAQFNLPIKLAIDANNNVFVADFNNLRIRKVTPAGVVTTYAGTNRGFADGAALSARFNSPNGLAFAPDGSLLVSDWQNGALRKIAPNGMVSTVLTNLGYMTSISVGSDGSWFVCNTLGGSNNYHKFAPNGTRQWSMSSAPGFQDGDIGVARFVGSSRPIFLNNGNFIFADDINHRIRLVITDCNIQTPPSLISAPTNLVIGLGDPLTLQASVAGTPPFAFQWLFNGTNLDWATSPQLVIPAATMADAGEYSLFVSNAFGTVTGVVANVSVLILPPAIVTQPASQTVLAGSTATFTVLASGTSPKTYQWYFNTAPLADATNTTLVRPAVTLANQGQYWVTVENTEGAVTSAVATLTVQIPPAIVQVTSPTVPSGLPAVVPVLLVANGNESALQFSVTYTTNQVSLLDVALSGVATNATLFLNNSQLGSGRVGVILALPTGQTFPAGTQELVHLNFLILLSTNTNTMTIGFSDLPTARQLVDAQAQVVPAIYTFGTMTILPADFEADVAPRGAPDRLIMVADLVQIGRFVAGLDALTNATEFQRADCAPRSDGGNGVLSVSDWVQAGRYAALIDPLQVASGPTEPVTVPGLVRADLQPRNDGGNACTVTVAEASLKLGETNRLAILLTADGTACAIGFVLHYDSNQLSFVSGSLGVTNAQLNFNTSKAASGQLGVVSALSTGNTYAPGEQQVIYLDFVVAPTVRSSVNLSFSSSTTLGIVREVADTNANSLTVAWQGKSLGVILPPLQIGTDNGPSGKTLKFSWPQAAGSTVLEESDSLIAPNWTPVQQSPTPVNGNNELTIPTDGRQRFYRLKTQ